MFEKIRKMKNEKGFTLVELIVVLVILAILAALLVPALTGYIDKANQEKVIAECRSVVVAAQTTVSEYYGLGKDPADTDKDAALAQIKTLAEAPDSWKYEIKFDTVNGESNVITQVVFTDEKASVTYTKTSAEAGTYSIVGSAKTIANSTLAKGQANANPDDNADGE